MYVGRAKGDVRYETVLNAKWQIKKNCERGLNLLRRDGGNIKTKCEGKKKGR